MLCYRRDRYNFITGDVSPDSSEHIPPARLSPAEGWGLHPTRGEYPSSGHYCCSSSVLRQAGLSGSALQVSGGRKLRTREEVELGQGQEAGGAQILFASPGLKIHILSSSSHDRIVNINHSICDMWANGPLPANVYFLIHPLPLPLLLSEY